MFLAGAQWPGVSPLPLPNQPSFCWSLLRIPCGRDLPSRSVRIFIVFIDGIYGSCHPSNASQDEGYAMDFNNHVPSWMHGDFEER